MRAYITNNSCWISTANTTTITTIVNTVLAECFTVLGFLQHHFTPFGFTCMWLLAESHLAVHSFPEENTCYVELSSCNSSAAERFSIAFRALCDENQIIIHINDSNGLQNVFKL